MAVFVKNSSFILRLLFPLADSRLIVQFYPTIVSLDTFVSKNDDGKTAHLIVGGRRSKKEARERAGGKSKRKENITINILP